MSAKFDARYKSVFKIPFNNLERKNIHKKKSERKGRKKKKKERTKQKREVCGVRKERP